MTPETSVTPQMLWEEAYRRFETPEQEIRKFIRRLKSAGAIRWPREARIVELFAGRGNGLHALARLGFTSLEGIDISLALAAEYQGPARVLISDCRQLPLPDASRDILIVQGGLHHLPAFPADLETTLREASRVLRQEGLFMAVEPWQTPFLSLVHAFSRNRLVRRVSPKFDALATMIRYEQRTYDQWLGAPQPIMEKFHKYFRQEQRGFRFGKLHFLGRKR